MSHMIRGSFDEYLRRVGLADVGPEQIRELRRAFFAGAWEILGFVEVTRKVDVEEADERAFMLKSMRVECEEFNWRVFEGKD